MKADLPLFITPEWALRHRHGMAHPPDNNSELAGYAPIDGLNLHMRSSRISIWPAWRCSVSPR